MRLALHTDYALRTLLYLAGNPGRASVGEVAQFYRISKDHVAKVVQSLARQGYVRSIRGIGGGIELAKSPRDIRVGQVILDCEGNMHLLECVNVLNICVIQSGCKLKAVLAEAERIQLDYLHSVTLGDIALPGSRLLQITEATREQGEERRQDARGRKKESKAKQVAVSGRGGGFKRFPKSKEKVR
jgi:Rrf2 family nitric oxide-sensitive transcriptional repressor